MSYLYGGGMPQGMGGGYGTSPYAMLAQMQQMGGGMGGNPLMQQYGPPPGMAQPSMQGQPQAPQYSPNQMLAQQMGSMSRDFYSPFNSPYGGQRGPGPNYPQMQPQQAEMGQTMGTGQFPLNPMPPMQQQPGMNPSIGLSDIVRQMQGGMSPIASRQALGGLAGVPQRGPGMAAPPLGSWSSQGRSMLPPPTMPNQFAAQNQTRGMSWNPATGRPWGAWQGGGNSASGGIPNRAAPSAMGGMAPAITQMPMPNRPQNIAGVMGAPVGSLNDPSKRRF